MEDKLKKYVEGIFEEAPKTKKAVDLKEEIIANLLDKYNDLKTSGKTDEDSYNIAVASIGNIEELVNSLKEPNMFSDEAQEKQRKKSAFIVAIAIGLYIFSVIPIIVLGGLSELTDIGDKGMLLEIIGVGIMFVMIGIATMLIVYNGISKPKYKGTDETMVEEFKEWRAKKDSSNAVKKSINTVIWVLITIIYLAFSFTFGTWAYSWLIFIIGAAITNIIDAVFKIARKEK